MALALLALVWGGAPLARAAGPTSKVMFYLHFSVFLPIVSKNSPGL
jgi:hypothetical protein